MNWMHIWSQIVLWIVQHPLEAYLTIFLISLSESLAVIGLFVPGTIMMVGIGALAGNGTLDIMTTLIAAMAGAIAGDGLSYWLGHHYHQQIRNLWPFRSHPQLLAHGETFFHRHGGKSVFLGRFVGPVRPVIPVIAGMLDMSPGHFVLVNILSAVGWAVAYIIPGVVLGSSLTLVGAVSTRLSILLLCLGGMLWLAFILVKQAYRYFMYVGPKGKKRLLTLLCLGLIAASWTFLGVVEDLLTGDPLLQADHAVYHFLQSLRSPWGDSLMVTVTELGDAWSNSAVVAAVLLFLLFRKQFRAALYWLVAIGGSMGLVQLFKWTLHRPRPITIYHGVSSWGFPSGHATMSVVVYGFLSVLLLRSLPSRWRWLPFVLALGASLLIAFSRIYLGAHWLSDILGGVALGWIWVTLLGVVYVHRTPNRSSGQDLRLLAGTALLALLLAGSWHISRQHMVDMDRYQVRTPIQVLSLDDWLNQGYQQLPQWRYTLLGDREQPLTLQVAGKLDKLAAQLKGKGWRESKGLNFKQLLNPFVSGIDIADLPLLPRLSDGREEALLMVKPMPESRMVIRLWPTSFRLDNGSPLWVGTVESEIAKSLAKILTLPLGKNDYDAALNLLKKDISPLFFSERLNDFTEITEESNRWNWHSNILLVDEQ